MIHTNIRIAAKNMNKFDLYLNNLKHGFPIIALSETGWMKIIAIDTAWMDIMPNITVVLIGEEAVYCFISKIVLNTPYGMNFAFRMEL